MTLKEELEALIGKRVRLESAIARQDWMVVIGLTPVEGGIWVYGANGHAVLVVEEGFKVEVLPVEGSFDESPPPIQMRAVGVAKANYGLSAREERGLCQCPGCRTRVRGEVRGEEPLDDVGLQGGKAVFNGW